MADNVVKFPDKKGANLRARTQMLQARLDEIEVENKYMNDDIEYLQSALKKNLDEAEEILKKFAMINGENKPVMNEWGDDFEFTPDFDLPELETTLLNEQMDRLLDNLSDAAKKLEDAVTQLVLDLDINPDNEDK